MESKETTHFRKADLPQYLMLKNGNYLYKIPYKCGWAVLKVYYGDRNLFQYVSKTLGNVLIANQTSFMPAARKRTELDCLDLWRDAGFRVFGTYDDVVVDDIPEEGYATYEYVPGRLYVDLFSDPSISLQGKKDLWLRFLPLWHKRHRLALDQREPRFVHENGDLKHIMLFEDELVFFDFEMVFRSRERVREFVGREILSFLKSLGKSVGEEHWDEFLALTVENYPSRDMLDYTYEFAFRNSNLFLRLGRWLDRQVKPRAKKPFAKYMVARKLHDILHKSPA
jgi:hypothetical protein